MFLQFFWVDICVDSWGKFSQQKTKQTAVGLLEFLPEKVVAVLKVRELYGVIECPLLMAEILHHQG